MRGVAVGSSLLSLLHKWYGGPKKFCIGWVGVSWEKAGVWKKRFGWYIGMFVTLGWGR
jgi:hypothetical protein